MDLFKYETHAHTSRGSACGKNTGAEMAEYYKSLGYAGLIITDHFISGNTAADFNLPWEEAVEAFCSGYKDAKRRGDEIGLDVFFGFEYCFKQTEFLIYGFGQDRLVNNPQIFKRENPSLRRALTDFKEAGALIIHAHPFRQRDYIELIRLLPDLTEIVETHNAADPEEANARAEIYADMYGLGKIAGGDAHCNRSKTSGIGLKNRAESYEELLEKIKANDYVIIK